MLTGKARLPPLGSSIPKGGIRCRCRKSFWSSPARTKFARDTAVAGSSAFCPLLDSHRNRDRGVCFGLPESFSTTGAASHCPWPVSDPPFLPPWLMPASESPQGQALRILACWRDGQ